MGDILWGHPFKRIHGRSGKELGSYYIVWGVGFRA